MTESAIRAFSCSICNKAYRELPFSAMCEDCGKALSALYEYEEVRVSLRRRPLSERPHNIWRFEEMLPVSGVKTVGVNTGFTPLVHAKQLGRRLGMPNLWVKNDTVNHPTLTYKDRVVSVALAQALADGHERLGCVSTGNVGNSVGAIARQAGIDVAVFYPRQVDRAKMLVTAAYGARIIRLDGTYDEVNAICRDLARVSEIPFVNINLRPYYAEGAKTMAYEIAEQLDWQPPDHCLVPVAGTTLIRKVIKGFWELEQVGLTGKAITRVHATQAAGCSPVVSAVLSGAEEIEPVVPNTIADSIAIGAPGEGGIAAHEIRTTGGSAAAVSDEEILSAMALLAETEGILVEPAGGTTVAGLLKLLENGTISPSERVVVAVTGNGLKTTDAIKALPGTQEIEPVNMRDSGEAFSDWLGGTPAHSVV